MNKENRLYELFFDKNVWISRGNYVIFGFIIGPLIIGLATATKCEFQKHIVRNEEGIYGKTTT